MTTHVRDGAVRDALKLPKEIAAKLCGVSVPTLRQYEADPLSVSENSRAKCIEAFAIIRVLDAVRSREKGSSALDAFVAAARPLLVTA